MNHVMLSSKTLMNIKKITYIIIIIFFMGLILKSCLNADIPEKNGIQQKASAFDITRLKYPGDYKTVLINGAECRQARGEVGKFGGTLYSSTIGEGPKTFNPWTAMDATSSTFGDLMFDGLTSTDAYTGKVVPLLAKSIQVNKSGTEYTVKLRKGLKWSDGKPITADDVTFTWNVIVAQGFGNTSMRDNVLIDSKMPKVEKTDDLTVKFTTPKPFAPFLRQLSLNIAPKHILEPVTKQGQKAFASFWTASVSPKKLVTSGMFKLYKYIPAQRIEFRRNQNYYAVDKRGQKLPYLDNYIVYIVADLNNEVLKFEAKELDILSVKGDEAARFKEMEKNSDYKLYDLGPDTGTTFAVFNLNREKNQDGKFYVDPVKQRWFNDINFRTAVDYALDRDNMVSNILSGVGAPLFTAESLPSIFLNKKLEHGHARNINLAKKYLAKSGFKLNKKGVLEDKYGNIVEFNLLTNAGNTEREATGVMFKQDLEELGIKVNFKPLEFNVLVGKLVNTLDWDMVIIGLTGSALEPHLGRNVWDSYGAMHLFNIRKDRNIHDLRPWETELDRIFEEGAKEINFNKRQQTYDRYQEIIYNNRPLLYLYSPLRIYAVRKRFGNIRPTPIGGVVHNLEEIYIK